MSLAARPAQRSEAAAAVDIGAGDLPHFILVAKGIGIFLVFAHHYARSAWEARRLSEPALAQWSFARFSQAVPVDANGLWESILLFLAHYGYAGVHLFVVASGLGLALGASASDRFAPYLYRRLRKLMPPFWLAVVFFYLVLALGSGPGAPLDLLVRKLTLVSQLIPAEFFSINSPMWYVALALQLYLVFPWLLRCAQRHGALALPAFLLAAYVWRAWAGGATAMQWHPYMGHSVVINWLPIFYAAIVAGLWLRQGGRIEVGWLRLMEIGAGAIALSMAGHTWAIAYPLLDQALAAAMVALVLVSLRMPQALQRAMALLGAVSFMVYLYHRPVITKAVHLWTQANPGGEPASAALFCALLAAIAGGSYAVIRLAHAWPALRIVFPGDSPAATLRRTER